jgi:choline dehydrogenase-like flavoprotein
VLSHLFGGCVLGDDPATSVVGPDLHVRGVRQLHVVDASAIPTTLGVNPQHTIMAMAMITALRLANADHALAAAA